MEKTIAFVTNQHICDRIICAARKIADETDTELVVVGIQNSDYELNPQAVDYLFSSSKKNQATMRLLFTEETLVAMGDIIDCYESKYLVTGMPSSHTSVVYDLWKEFPEKNFFTVEPDGQLVEVACSVQSIGA